MSCNSAVVTGAGFRQRASSLSQCQFCPACLFGLSECAVHPSSTLRRNCVSDRTGKCARKSVADRTDGIGSPSLLNRECDPYETRQSFVCAKEPGTSSL